ncbi:MAG TPA: efflux RND transporter periplasmic adaptor subunit [Fibrobacteraceae bacterium]|nr:efflux RND transporter periplasmic adaptor subunit [Fibrobacteraceae bacterium]
MIRNDWLGAASALLILFGCQMEESPAPSLVGMAETREIMVASKLAGRLSEVNVSEGDSVAAGQVVARITSPEVEAKVAQARGVVKSAEAKLALLHKGARTEELQMAQNVLSQATEARKLAETTWNRVKKLLDDSALTRQQADEAEFKWRSAQENEAAASSRVEMIKSGARPEEIAAAEGAVQSARNALLEATSWSKETEISCPISGVVQKRYLAAGEIAAAGAPILVLIQPGETWVALPVREDQLAGVHLGQDLVGKIPALGGVDQHFKVTWMTAMGDFATWRATSRRGDTDLRSFEVRLEPIKPIPGFLPGMTVQFPSPKPQG